MELRSPYVFNKKHSLVSTGFLVIAIALFVGAEVSGMGFNIVLLIALTVFALLFFCSLTMIKAVLTAETAEEKLKIEYELLGKRVYSREISFDSIKNAVCETSPVTTRSGITMYYHTLSLAMKKGGNKRYFCTFLKEDGKPYDIDSEEYKNIVEYHMLTRICRAINESKE